MYPRLEYVAPAIELARQYPFAVTEVLDLLTLCAGDVARAQQACEAAVRLGISVPAFALDGLPPVQNPRPTVNPGFRHRRCLSWIAWIRPKY